MAKCSECGEAEATSGGLCDSCGTAAIVKSAKKATEAKIRPKSNGKAPRKLAPGGRQQSLRLGRGEVSHLILRLPELGASGTRAAEVPVLAAQHDASARGSSRPDLHGMRRIVLAGGEQQWTR